MEGKITENSYLIEVSSIYFETIKAKTEEEAIQKALGYVCMRGDTLELCAEARVVNDA